MLIGQLEKLNNDRLHYLHLHWPHGRNFRLLFIVCFVFLLWIPDLLVCDVCLCQKLMFMLSLSFSEIDPINLDCSYEWCYISLDVFCKCYPISLWFVRFTDGSLLVIIDGNGNTERYMFSCFCLILIRVALFVLLYLWSLVLVSCSGVFKYYTIISMFLFTVFYQWSLVIVFFSLLDCYTSVRALCFACPVIVFFLTVWLLYWCTCVVLSMSKSNKCSSNSIMIKPMPKFKIGYFKYKFLF